MVQAEVVEMHKEVGRHVGWWVEGKRGVGGGHVCRGGI